MDNDSEKVTVGDGMLTGLCDTQHEIFGRSPAISQCCGIENPTRIGFATLHPGGMADNSPTFQRWDLDHQWIQVPKGRLKMRARSAVPSGLIHLRRFNPALKGWAIVTCPPGTRRQRILSQLHSDAQTTTVSWSLKICHSTLVIHWSLVIGHWSFQSPRSFASAPTLCLP